MTEPFDQGERRGYLDQTSGKVTRDSSGTYTSIPTEWVGDAEYAEGYTEGAEQAEVDHRSRPPRTS